MNISKRLAEARYYRSTVEHQKKLFKMKLEAMHPQNWNLTKLAKSSDLIVAGDGNFPHEWDALKKNDTPFRLSSFQPSVVKSTVTDKVLKVRSARTYNQRNSIWAKVLGFLLEEQVPTLAGQEYVIFDHEDPDDKTRQPVLGIATFGYPFISDMPNIGDEYYVANYDTYYSEIETIRERMGLRHVSVEPVGIITEEGKEINGTIGGLGFRVWWSPTLVPSDNFLQDDNPWTSSLQIKVNMIEKLRKIDGLGYATDGRLLTRTTKKHSGAYRIITVVSDNTTAQDYMDRADEIRKLLNVPGLIITPFGSLNDENKLEHGVLHDADENGVHHTAFIFYLGDEKNVVNEETDSDEDGKPLAALSGFMPIHSASYLLSPWVAKPLEVVAATA